VTGLSASGTSPFGPIFDYATIKYSPSGDTLWVRRYNGPGILEDVDKANDLVVDGSGNVYVTGTSPDSGTSFDFTTIKYSPSGDTLWVRRYDGPENADDEASALAVDDSGNLCVTGRSGGFPNYDYATVKYKPNGDTAWVRHYNGPGDSYDEPYALAVDTSGNVYVTGYTDGGGSFRDYATIKYAPNGDSLWVRRYNGPGNHDDVANALAVHINGNVYVTGYSDGSGSSSDYATIKYAPNGDTLWVRRYNGPAPVYVYPSGKAFALALDNAGNVYVTGYCFGSGTSWDYTTIKYAPNGDTLWAIRYNGPGNSSDYAYALALDTAGNVYVTGWSEGIGTFADYATIKYSPCSAIPGDANASGTYTLADAIAIFNYVINKPGCSPSPLCWLSGLLCRGDWDGSTTVTLADAIRGVNYIFNKPGGPWNALPIGACCLAAP